jgi:acetyl esterase/lipase
MVDVAGETAMGRVAFPTDRPKGLVVFFHGYGHTAQDWDADLTRTAEADQVVAIAMDYRGNVHGSPNHGWRVAEGAADSIAAAQQLERDCRGFATIVAYGVSMGGNASGLALASKATRADGSHLFDWWFDIEGAANVVETYQEARAVAQSGNAFASMAQGDIEAEMGGTFEQVPAAYLDHTVTARVDDVAASGIGGVVMSHGVGDGLVPYDQSRELAAALRARGVPVQFFTFGTRADGTEAGTTLDGYIPAAHDSPFAGHGNENHSSQMIMAKALERLDALFRGETPSCDGEFVVDGKTGAAAPPFTPCA